MRILCVNCQRKMVVAKNGVHVVETFGRDSDDPYKLWNADLLECPDCHFQVVSGFGANNYAEHYQPDFSEKLERAEPKFYDKSCAGAR